MLFMYGTHCEIPAQTFNKCYEVPWLFLCSNDTPDKTKMAAISYILASESTIWKRQTHDFYKQNFVSCF